MGRYVADTPYYIEGTEARIREVLTEYNDNIHRFETKHSKRAGVRARNNLLELWHLCRKRRKEILEQSKTQAYGYWEHPSWAGIDEDDE
jgi:hypothetical protein